MKKIILLSFSLALIYSCGSDDDGDSSTDDNAPIEPTTMQDFAFNEPTEGDLSDDATSPTTVIFAPGDNRVLARQEDGDVDYFTVLIPDGYQLAQINVENYEAADDAFIGIASGEMINGNMAPDLLGGLVYGDGATGFTPPLPTGTYTIWLNQTGTISEVLLNFVLTMPTDSDNIVYDESVDGDLSDDGTTPTEITFGPGNNRIISDQESGNADYFTVVIPDGYQLAAINLENYEAADDAFIGIVNAATIDGNMASDLSGGLIYGSGDVGTDILPEMGMQYNF